jgi:hypothetical protein
MNNSLAENQAGVSLIELIIVMLTIIGIIAVSVSSMLNEEGALRSQQIADASYEYLGKRLTGGKDTLSRIGTNFTITIDESKDQEAVVISDLDYDSCADLSIFGLSRDMIVSVNNSLTTMPAYYSMCGKKKNSVTYQLSTHFVSNQNTSGTQDVF